MWDWSFNPLCFQALKVGHVLSQDVDSVSQTDRPTPSSLHSTQHLVKEVGVLSDVGTLPTMHCGHPDDDEMRRGLAALFDPMLCLWL